ncbi:unnamed protein product [Caenorhabditis brenneri]
MNQSDTQTLYWLNRYWNLRNQVENEKNRFIETIIMLRDQNSILKQKVEELEQENRNLKELQQIDPSSEDQLSEIEQTTVIEYQRNRRALSPIDTMPPSPPLRTFKSGEFTPEENKVVCEFVLKQLKEGKSLKSLGLLGSKGWEDFELLDRKPRSLCNRWTSICDNADQIKKFGMPDEDSKQLIDAIKKLKRRKGKSGSASSRCGSGGASFGSMITVCLTILFLFSGIASAAPSSSSSLSQFATVSKDFGDISPITLKLDGLLKLKGDLNTLIGGKQAIESAIGKVKDQKEQDRLKKMWTHENLAALQKNLATAKAVSDVVSKNKIVGNMTDFKAPFEKASEVQGCSIDIKRLASSLKGMIKDQTVATSLESSKNLDLQFVKYDQARVGGVITGLQAYFDSVFGSKSDRMRKKGICEDGDSSCSTVAPLNTFLCLEIWVWGVIGAVCVVLLAIGITVFCLWKKYGCAFCCKCCKRKTQGAKSKTSTSGTKISGEKTPKTDQKNEDGAKSQETGQPKEKKEKPKGSKEKDEERKLLEKEKVAKEEKEKRNKEADRQEKVTVPKLYEEFDETGQKLIGYLDYPVVAPAGKKSKKENKKKKLGELKEETKNRIVAFLKKSGCTEGQIVFYFSKLDNRYYVLERMTTPTQPAKQLMLHLPTPDQFGKERLHREDSSIPPNPDEPMNFAGPPVYCTAFITPAEYAEVLVQAKSLKACPSETANTAQSIEDPTAQSIADEPSTKTMQTARDASERKTGGQEETEDSEFQFVFLEVEEVIEIKEVVEDEVKETVKEIGYFQKLLGMLSNVFQNPCPKCGNDESDIEAGGDSQNQPESMVSASERSVAGEDEVRGCSDETESDNNSGISSAGRDSDNESVHQDVSGFSDEESCDDDDESQRLLSGGENDTNEQISASGSISKTSTRSDSDTDSIHCGQDDSEPSEDKSGYCWNFFGAIFGFIRRLCSKTDGYEPYQPKTDYLSSDALSQVWKDLNDRQKRLMENERYAFMFNENQKFLEGSKIEKQENNEEDMVSCQE